MRETTKRVSGSFRDPSGFLFVSDGTLLRAVNNLYQVHYDHLMGSGLYKSLVEESLLVSHTEVQLANENKAETYKIIQPEKIPFISYPYEWCFSQLKDAALVLLKIQRLALQSGMILKDASAYNMQFYKGKPILIDTLSFEIYQEGQPWLAYRQFCQHFLAPLSLMVSRDSRLSQLMRIFIDGLPLDLSSTLLPVSTWLKPKFLLHIHLHAKAQKRYEAKNVGKVRRKVKKSNLLAMLDHLESAITHMKLAGFKTEWGDYYSDTNYSSEALAHKKQLLETYISEVKPQNVWDLGANTGLLSRVATQQNINTVAFDLDPAAVEKNYHEMQKCGETKMLPLCLDLANPSPALGWANEERLSLTNRGPTDLVLALALIHHLSISQNIPLGHVANFLSKICRYLIIEFVAKSDSQVQRLLRVREDIFPHYTQSDFESAFGSYFSLLKQEPINGTQRILYLMKNNAESKLRGH